jgi:hypothetical protein
VPVFGHFLTDFQISKLNLGNLLKFAVKIENSNQKLEISMQKLIFV